MQKKLNRLYCKYNRREYIHPDPLEFLYHYDHIRDREVAGLIASSLAYGKVDRILVSVSRVLEIMGPSPFEYLCRVPVPDINRHFRSFVHRFARGDHMTALLTGMKQVIGEFGSLSDCFRAGYRDSDTTVLPALSFFADRISRAGNGCGPGHLMPCPEKGSACKRLHLFLRWMVRCDAVDPGGWHDIPPSKLIVPLDVHMFRIARDLGLTDRRQADIRTAVQVTEGFRRWAPADPVRYDFALTRFGIRGGREGICALKKELSLEGRRRPSSNVPKNAAGGSSDECL